MPEKTVLVTGASGVVGAALLPELTRHHVITLTHRSASPPGGAEQVLGDLTRPRMGLGDRAHRRLAGAVDVIVHCAAVTDFAAGKDATFDLNVQGTEAVLDLADASGAAVIYVSTAFVARAQLTRRAQACAELDAASSPDEYLESKRAAERLVAGSGLPAVIVRPSVVIGDSRTGQIARFQGLHSIAVAALRGYLPLIPLRPDTRIDFVPQDLVGRVIAGLVDDGSECGEAWITAAEHAPTATRMLELCLQVADERGLAIPLPRLVPPDMVDRLIRPVFIDPLPRQARRRFDDLLAMSALFAGAEPFPSSLTGLPCKVEPVDTAWFEAALLTSLHYLAAMNNIGAEPLKEVA